MNVVTIPKKLANKGDLVVIPRREYEALLTAKKFREVAMTPTQRKDLNQARKDLKLGKTLTLDEFSKKLGFTS